MKNFQLICSIIFLNIFIFANRVLAEISYSCEGQKCIDDFKIFFSVVKPFLPYLAILPLIFCLVIIFLIWLESGKEEKSFEVIEFNPIEGFSMLELDYIYNQALTQRGMLAELSDLEKRGYVTCEEKGDDITFYKTKDYDGNDDLEKIFMEYVFLMDCLKSSPIDAFMISKFYIKLKKKLAGYVKTLGGCFNSCLFYMVYLLTSFIYILLPSIYFLNLIDKSNEAALGACGGLISFMIPFFVLGTIKAVKNKLYKEILIVGGITILIISISLNLIFSVNGEFLPKFLIIAGIIGLGLFLIIAGELPKYTSQGREIFQKIKGLKLYLEKVEVPRLAITKQENPEYYHKILPYLYLLELRYKNVTNLQDRTILVG